MFGALQYQENSSSDNTQNSLLRLYTAFEDGDFKLQQ
jgi:hypothetical protein